MNEKLRRKLGDHEDYKKYFDLLRIQKKIHKDSLYG